MSEGKLSQTRKALSDRAEEYLKSSHRLEKETADDAKRLGLDFADDIHEYYEEFRRLFEDCTKKWMIVSADPSDKKVRELTEQTKAAQDAADKWKIHAANIFEKKFHLAIQEGQKKTDDQKEETPHV